MADREDVFQEPIYNGGIHAMGRRIHQQRVALRCLQDLVDRSNAQARYRAEHARRVKAAEEAQKYRRQFYALSKTVDELLACDNEDDSIAAEQRLAEMRKQHGWP